MSVKGETFVEECIEATISVENKWKVSVPSRHTCWHTISTFEVGNDLTLSTMPSPCGWYGVVRVLETTECFKHMVTKLYSQNFSLDMKMIISGWPKVSKDLDKFSRNSISFLIRHGNSNGPLSEVVLSNQQILIVVGRNLELVSTSTATICQLSSLWLYAREVTASYCYSAPLYCCDVTFMTTPLIYCLFHGEFQRGSRQSTEVHAAFSSSCNPFL